KSLQEQAKTLWLFEHIKLPSLMYDRLGMAVCFQNIRKVLHQVLQSNRFRLFLEKKVKQVIQYGMTKTTENFVKSDFVDAPRFARPKVIEQAQADAAIVGITDRQQVSRDVVQDGAGT